MRRIGSDSPNFAAMRQPRIPTLIVLVLLCICNQLLAQDSLSQGQKGKCYAFWGWNRGIFSNSDIHFWGDGYNFTLIGVRAHDAPYPFAINPYFNPLLVTLPQTNARIGYFVGRQTSLSVGLDHMKYVMDQIQAVPIDGFISGTGTGYDRTYTNYVIYTRTNFLTFEHTDGLNYVNAELRLHRPLWSWHRKRWLPVDLESFHGAGAGALIPKTNSRMFGQARHDAFHLSGYGAHVVMGLGLTLWKHFVIQPELKGGYMALPDVRTTAQADDRASHRFWFGEFDVLFGGSFYLGRRAAR